MEPEAFAIENQNENYHWWYVGRRKLFSKIISKLNLPLSTRFLDIGTSTGTNLRMLEELGFANRLGVDPSDVAKKFCESKNLGQVEIGDICHLPFPENRFDVILATDVIEHVEDDQLAVQEICRVLKPQGYGIITVPAFPCLWGQQDEISHHKRRYVLQKLKKLLQDNGLKIHSIFYFNYLLFIPIWLIRTFIRAVGIELKNETQINNLFLNAMFNIIFSFDVMSASWLKPPFGVSIFVLCQKNEKIL